MYSEMNSKLNRLDNLRQYRFQRKIKTKTENRPPFRPPGSAKLEKYEVLKPPLFVKKNSIWYGRNDNSPKNKFRRSNEKRVLPPKVVIDEASNSGTSSQNLPSFAPRTYEFKGINNVKYDLTPNIKTEENEKVAAIKTKICHSTNVFLHTRDRAFSERRPELQKLISPSLRKCYSDKKKNQVKHNLNQGYNISSFKYKENFDVTKGIKDKGKLTIPSQSSCEPSINRTITLSPGSSKILSSVEESFEDQSPVSTGFQNKHFELLKYSCNTEKGAIAKNAENKLNNISKSNAPKQLKYTYKKNVQTNMPKNNERNSRDRILRNVTNRSPLHDVLRKRNIYAKMNDSTSCNNLNENTEAKKDSFLNSSNQKLSASSDDTEMFVTCLTSPAESPRSSVSESPEVLETLLRRDVYKINMELEINKENYVLEAEISTQCRETPKRARS